MNQVSNAFTIEMPLIWAVWAGSTGTNPYLQSHIIYKPRRCNARSPGGPTGFLPRFEKIRICGKSKIIYSVEGNLLEIYNLKFQKPRRCNPRSQGGPTGFLPRFEKIRICGKLQLFILWKETFMKFMTSNSKLEAMAASREILSRFEQNRIRGKYTHLICTHIRSR